jgi:hypothetical protein
VVVALAVDLLGLGQQRLDCWTMPVISSPTRSRYSSNIMSRSASRMRCRITCLAVCAAMRPKSSGVTSRSSIWSRYSANLAGSISGSCGSTGSPVSGSM